MNTLAVFIDAENVGTSEFPQIQSNLKKLGQIIVYNIYADWSDSSMKNWLILSKENGIKTIQCDKVSNKKFSRFKINSRYNDKLIYQRSYRCIHNYLYRF